MILKENRTVLNGSCISYNNNYYISIDKDNKPIFIYKDSSVDVWENIFDQSIKIFKNNILYNTKQIEGR